MKTSTQPRCPPMGKWITNLWYIHTTECYLAIKNDLCSHESSWRNLKYIFLSETRQSEKSTYYRITNISRFGKGKTMAIVNNQLLPVAGGWSGRVE